MKSSRNQLNIKAIKLNQTKAVSDFICWIIINDILGVENMLTIFGRTFVS